MPEIPDQIPVWEGKHKAGDHAVLYGVPSPLAEITEPYFPRQARILELGCGVGRDAVFFAEHGHRVTATDGSKVVIGQNRQRINHKNITFDILDMRQPLPYESDSYDVVYANLSLHYYSHDRTGAMFGQIGRVLRPNGILAFACKAFDSLHAGGVQLEPNIFASPSGATIHLFSEPYVHEVTDPIAKIKHLDEIEEDFNGRHSRIVRCIAVKEIRE